MNVEIVIKQYAMIQKGMRAEIVKQWIDPNGNRWYRLDFGAYQDGTRMRQTVPASITNKP